MTEEDALQQCGVVFARCVRLYHRRDPSPRTGRLPDGGRARVDNAAWFMSLFKRALANEFNMLAVRVGRSYRAERDFVVEANLSGAGHEYNPGPLLAGLSKELREVLRVVAGAPSELLEMLLRETDDKSWSRRLCRLCGISATNETIVAELRAVVERDDDR